MLLNGRTSGHTDKRTTEMDTLLKHPRLTVLRRTGSEGPRHDPYAYEETMISGAEYKLMIHEGLGSYMQLSRLDGSERVRWSNTDHADLLLSRIVCGYTRKEIERIIAKRHSRCTSCGGRDFTCESGYPGETLRVCVHCHLINGSHMNYSTIE